jgi:hypothetical protein
MDLLNPAHDELQDLLVVGHRSAETGVVVSSGRALADRALGRALRSVKDTLGCGNGAQAEWSGKPCRRLGYEALAGIRRAALRGGPWTDQFRALYLALVGEGGPNGNNGAVRVPHGQRDRGHRVNGRVSKHVSIFRLNEANLVQSAGSKTVYFKPFIHSSPMRLNSPAGSTSWGSLVRAVATKKTTRPSLGGEECRASVALMSEQSAAVPS